MLTGYANGDGISDSNDAVLVLRYYADSAIEGIDLDAADVNGDGIVDANSGIWQIHYAAPPTNHSQGSYVILLHF